MRGFFIAMNKIKYDLVRQIYDDTSLTSDELNMIIYLAKNGDDFGTVQGVYYKECAKELSMCDSQFYNVINSLQEKNYIIKTKEYHQDMDITLNNNMFIYPDDKGNPVEDYRDYLNLNMKLFEDKEFYSLKVYAKKLIIALIVKTVNDRARRSKRAGKTYLKVFHVPARQYQIYADKLHITRRMIKQYFKDIEKWVSTYNDSIYTDTDIISIQENAMKKPEVVVSQKRKSVIRSKTDRYNSDLTYVKMLCRRNKMEYENESLSDAAMLLSQYQNKAKEIGQNIRSVAERMLRAIGNTLSAAGLNKAISNYFANQSTRMLPMISE